MRALKRRLTALGDGSAEPAIASRLIELAHCDEAVPPGELPRVAQTGIAHASRSADWGSRVLARTWRLAAASAGASLITIGVLAFMLGSGETQPPVPKVTPSVDSYLTQHLFDAGQRPAKPGHSLARPARQPAAVASGTAAAKP